MPKGEDKPSPYGANQGHQIQAQISPDGKWAAYASSESGRYQVYVDSFPRTGKKLQVTSQGASQPRWRRDGKELFFVTPDLSLMAVDIKTDATVTAGNPHLLFKTGMSVNLLPIATGGGPYYDVSPDGQRFLVGVESPGGPPFNVILNWTTLLKK